MDISEIEAKTKNFNSLPFASEIKPPEILFTKDSTEVYLYLKKTPSNFFDGFIGFNTNETTKKLEINGQLNILLQNNLNSGEQLGIKYKSTENEQRDFSANLKIPFLFKSPIGVELGLKIFKQDSTFLTSEQQINLSYPINQRLTWYGGVSFVTSDKLQETPNPLIEDYKTSFINNTISYKSIKRGLFNLDKTKTDLTIGFGNRKTDSTKNQQLRASIYIEHLFKLNSRNNILIRNQTATINSSELFANELFRIGGVKSIHGFDEQSIQSSLHSIINTEYIYALSPNIYANTVFDYAYIENKNTDTRDRLIGIGLGLSIKQKSNVIRLVFANGKTDNQNFNFNNSKVHISLSTSF